MSIPVGWYGDQDSTQDYNPFTQDPNPPAPPIYNYVPNYGGYGVGRGYRYDRQWSRYKRDDKDDDGLDNEIGYPTDWEYPNWLIRMAQWRNF
jgi:hypothetical protein